MYLLHTGQVKLIIHKGDHCFKKETGPAGPTGRTVDRELSSSVHLNKPFRG